jgi:predicted hydrocarbon binding protein/predicted amino acid-binding ACT domain protein
MAEDEFGDREIGIYHTSKGRKLAQISILMKDVPGTLSKILAILAKHGFDLKLGWFDTSETGSMGRFSAFVDMSDVKADIKQVKQEISDTRLTHRIEISTAKDVIFDSHFKGLRMMDRDVLPIGIGEWSEMKRHVKPDALRSIGRSFGEVSVEYWSDSIGSLTNKLTTWERILESRGIGDKVEMDIKRGIVTIQNCFSSREYRGEGPSCFVVCGILEGILSQILMEDVQVEEIECLGNYDSRCVFRITSPSTNKLKDFERISERLDGI